MHAQTDELVKGSVGCETRVLRVAEVPTEVTFREGAGGPVAESQGHSVDISARPGTETGVEIIRHAVGTGDAAGETEAFCLILNGENT